MFVRPAHAADITTFVEFGQRLITESPTYAQRGFNPVKAAAHFLHLINGGGAIFVIEVDGQIAGGFAGGIAEDWQSDCKVAFDFVLYVQPRYRKTGIADVLIETFEIWARECGANRIQCGTNTGINSDSTVRLYERMGFAVVGQFLEKEI